jgi:Phage integrase family
MSTAKRFTKRVFRHTNDDSAFYYIKVMFQGHRETFCTRTTVRSEAAIKAREIYVYLRANGWGPALAKYSDKPHAGPVKTLSEFAARVGATFDGQKRTIVDYIGALRRVGSEICGISRGTTKKYDFRSKVARERWLAKTDKIPLASLTREKIEAWRIAYVQSVGDNLDLIRSRKTSCNSILRQCGALFAPDRLERAGLSDLVNPFEKIKPFPAADMRYRGGLDPGKIFKNALTELATDPEALKALVLCLCAGLRRNEADKLEWTAFEWEQNVIRIAPTAVLHVKAKKLGEVSLEPEIMALFRGWYAKRTGNFVLESGIEARPGSSYSHYRAQKTFDRLTSWLREGAGLTSRNPIHELRKMFGSRVYLTYDLLAASLALRHSNVAVTAAHYLTKRPRVTVGFGALVESENVIPLPKANDQTNQKSLHVAANDA